MIKYTRQYLNKLEELFSETDYTLRYEKGNFRSGYCILNDARVVLVNKFYTLEGKINSLVDITRLIDLDPDQLSDKNKKLFLEIIETSSTT